MKKLITLALILASVFALCACGEAAPAAAPVTAAAEPVVTEKIVEVEKEVPVVPEKYADLINAIELGNYDGAHAIIEGMRPAPEYKEIVLTESNYSEYFEVDPNIPDFQIDSFGNPSFFTIFGYVKLKDEYYEKLVPEKNSDVKFNVYYSGKAIQVKADFAKKTYKVTNTGSKIEETTEVALWNQQISGKNMFAGSFGMMGGSSFIGKEEIYSCNQISKYEIKGVKGTLYLYE